MAGHMFSWLLMLLTCMVIKSEPAPTHGTPVKSGQLRGEARAADRHDGCITRADMDATITAFMHAVVSIGKEVGNCTSAKAAALGALDAAYAYDVAGVTVLFKPTMTVGPDVYRSTKEGALSYFIGTCVCPGIKDPSAAPTCGKAEGYFAPDSGFAFASSSGFRGWSKVERGGALQGGEFRYNIDGPFCHAAQAQGPICFTSAHDQSVACVDKTFGFVVNPNQKQPGTLRALLNIHHSSKQVLRGEHREENDTMTLKELLSDNEDLSSAEEEMENEPDSYWTPLEEEPENVTIADSDMDAETDNALVRSSAEISSTSSGWFTKWYGGSGGYKGARRVCPQGTFIKKMKVLSTKGFGGGVTGIYSTQCSRGSWLGSDRGSGFWSDSDYFYTYRGFRRATIWADNEVRAMCLGFKCTGAWKGRRYRVRCRKGHVISGYRARTGARLDAIKFLCRQKW